MPIKISNIAFTGTDGGLCGYISRGRIVYRMSNPVESKRIKTDPVFEGFRKSAGRMKQASPIAAGLYNQIPKEDKVYHLYRQLTGEAIRMLKEGVDSIVIKEKLQRQYIDPLLNKLLEPTQRTRRREKPRGCLSFSHMRFFYTAPYVVDRRGRKVCSKQMQPVDRRPALEQQFRQRYHACPEPAISLEPVRKRPLLLDQPGGLIFLGRYKEYRGLKMWLVPPQQMMDLQRSMKTGKYLSLWNAVAKVYVTNEKDQ
ncbi:MAG: hypothetical protein H7Y03_03885 [Chitinophagaceae bacterium]|nr:hypothetical protein [Chitinophagaceae bacterium]